MFSRAGERTASEMGNSRLQPVKSHRRCERFCFVLFGGYLAVLLIAFLHVLPRSRFLKS